MAERLVGGEVAGVEGLQRVAVQDAGQRGVADRRAQDVEQLDALVDGGAQFGDRRRVLGISLVTSIVVGIAGFVVSLPVEIVAQVLSFATPEYALLIGVASQALGTVLATAFTSPFTAVVTTLQYLDQRMRKEAYDVTLMSEAGITGA